MPALRSIAKVGLDVLLFAMITVALGEFSLRIYNSIDPLPIFHSDSYNRYRGKPFAPDWSSHLNSRGFKDVEYETAKAAGTTRILGIGDSVAFGVVPYEFNYLTLVEQGLERTGRPVELINMGIPGIGPREYLALIVREGFELEPDGVLLSFFIGNDFEGQEKRLVSHSHLASLITFVLSLWRKFDGQVVHASATYDDSAPTFTDEAYLEIELDRSAVFARGNPELAGRFEEALSHIAELKRACDDRNVALTIVLIPDEMQVSTALQARVVAASGRAPAEFDFSLPNRLLRARFEELGIDSIDLTPELSAHPPGDGLYRRNDSHWNIAGNALAARVIAEHTAARLASAAP
jgi:hypothetical protein